MKKVCIIVCSLLMAATLALGIATTASLNIPEESITLCDMDYDLVSY